jgi:hypothetical protein
MKRSDCQGSSIGRAPVDTSPASKPRRCTLSESRSAKICAPFVAAATGRKASLARGNRDRTATWKTSGLLPVVDAATR